MDKQILERELARLNTIYSPKKSLEELSVVAAAWFEDLGGLNNIQFCKAVATARQACDFFPVPHQIIKAHGDNIAASARARGAKQIAYAEKKYKPTADEWTKLKRKLLLIGKGMK